MGGSENVGGAAINSALLVRSYYSMDRLPKGCFDKINRSGSQ